MSEPTRTRSIPIRMRAGRPREAFDPLDHIAYADELGARLRRGAEAWQYIKPTTVGRNNQIWSALHSMAVAAQHKTDRVSSAVLTDFINGDDTLPSVPPTSLAGRMKGYGVTPRKISSMCYFKADLELAWREGL